MNFRELRNRLISSLWDYIGCPVILSNQVQPEAEPPFCIYTVTAPYIPDGGMGDYEIADVAEGVKISRMEMPSATFSFTFCSQNRTAENGSAVNGEDEAWAVADTTAKAGLMSDADKTKLDGMGATINKAIADHTATDAEVSEMLAEVYGE